MNVCFTKIALLLITALHGQRIRLQVEGVGIVSCYMVFIYSFFSSTKQTYQFKTFSLFSISGLGLIYSFSSWNIVKSGAGIIRKLI